MSKSKQERLAYIEAARRRQPVEELERKRDKAWRKGIWTVEDLDYSTVAGKLLYESITKIVHEVIWE